MASPIKGKQLEAGTITEREAATGGATNDIGALNVAGEGFSTNIAREDHIHAINTASGVISTVNAGDAASEGAADGLARRDHQHAVSTNVVGAIAIGDSASEGVSSALARADHRHALSSPTVAVDADASASSVGASAVVAREDHKHQIPTATPVTIATTNAPGVANTLSRSDHIHAHGTLGGGTLHAEVTTTVAGFMNAADKIKLDSLSDSGGFRFKNPARVAASANEALTGLPTIDGVGPLVDSERVLLTGQTNAVENGVWEVHAGAWTRPTDFSAGDPADGTFIVSEEGVSFADVTWLCTTDSGSATIDTDPLTFAAQTAATILAGSGLQKIGNTISVLPHVDGSILATGGGTQVGVLATDAQHGTLGGGALHDAVTVLANGFMIAADKVKLDAIETGATSNTARQEAVTTEVVAGVDLDLTDTLNFVPKTSASVILFLNGVQQEQGAGLDYTITGQTIRWLASTGTAVDMEVSDSLVAAYES